MPSKAGALRILLIATAVLALPMAVLMIIREVGWSNDPGLVGAWSALGGSHGLFLRADGSGDFPSTFDDMRHGITGPPMRWRTRSGVLQMMYFGEEGETSGWEQTPYRLSRDGSKLTLEHKTFNCDAVEFNRADL
jgi:hypothetical protein